jgi:hypothetical protein
MLKETTNKLLNSKLILWHVDLLLGNDHEIIKYRASVFS